MTRLHDKTPRRYIPSNTSLSLSTSTLPMAPRPLLLTGFMPRELALGLEDMRRLPAHALGPTDIYCLTGRHIATVDDYCGALLTDILALTGLPEVPKPALKECVIVARGTDGYRALFSWNELHNTAIGEGVVVVYEKGRQELDERLGTFALISASDLRLGPRHLRRLCEIRVLRISG
jgi:hypothetical protein